MYKVSFDEGFFDDLNHFIASMRQYYFDFYSNTGIYDEQKIVLSYFEKYETMKKDILNTIYDFCIHGIPGRNIEQNKQDVEICSFHFSYKSSYIRFAAEKNDTKQEIVVTSLKVYS